jgi:hypothetical protein
VRRQSFVGYRRAAGAEISGCLNEAPASPVVRDRAPHPAAAPEGAAQATDATATTATPAARRAEARAVSMADVSSAERQRRRRERLAAGRQVYAIEAPEVEQVPLYRSKPARPVQAVECLNARPDPAARFEQKITVPV